MKNLSIPLTSVVLHRPPSLTVGYTLPSLNSSLILLILKCEFSVFKLSEIRLRTSPATSYQLLNSASCQSLHFQPPTDSFSLSFTNTNRCSNLPPIVAGGKKVAKIQNPYFPKHWCVEWEQTVLEVQYQQSLITNLWYLCANGLLIDCCLFL